MPRSTPADDPRPSDRAERAYEALRAAIIEGALTPGTKLGEEALAAHYGVSRTLVRTVLQRLVGDGVVDSPPGRSAAVARPTIDEARDAFTVRAALEREGVRLVAERRDPAALARLRTHVRAEREAWESRRPTVSARLGGEFHLLIARESENTLLVRYMSEVVSRTALILSIYGRDIDQEISIAEHEQLLHMLEAGDADAACALVEHHLADVQRKSLGREADSGEELLAVLSRY
ncbi:GntR family transcriptional regulator [Microbacterium sp. KSW2-21]|uniref:GntR family transcriptional regulator n=1 Tax=Microbacterium algihabitans TaxID=3075992 RepID=A0ABU3RV55_9MICO|nr:GntR family transcriptional regulator [Microbacterium sp. KSW2-21]MDU0326776.1 GntR family transcriptional regulator [Microbacterium sp. KSW2-21]